MSEYLVRSPFDNPNKSITSGQFFWLHHPTYLHSFLALRERFGRTTSSGGCA